MDDCCRYMHLRHQQQQLSLTGGHARRLTLHKMATHNNSQHGHLEPHIFHHTTRGSIAGVLVSLASLKHARSVSAILIYCLLMLSMCILCTSLYFCYYFVACVCVASASILRWLLFNTFSTCLRFQSLAQPCWLIYVYPPPSTQTHSDFFFQPSSIYSPLPIGYKIESI